jgi:hypothetical protein
VDSVDLGCLGVVDIVEDVVPDIALHWFDESVIGPEPRLTHPHCGCVDGRHRLRGDDAAPAAHLLKTVDEWQANVAGNVRVHISKQNVYTSHALAAPQRPWRCQFKVTSLVIGCSRPDSIVLLVAPLHQARVT